MSSHGQDEKDVFTPFLLWNGEYNCFSINRLKVEFDTAFFVKWVGRYNYSEEIVEVLQSKYANDQ